VLRYRVTMAAGDWTALQNDTTASIYYPATFQCQEEPAISVGIRRKRSGAGEKVAVKIDFNVFTPGQEWRTLKKLSLEIGAGAFAPTDRGALVGEYLAWRMQRRGGAHVSRSALCQLDVNGTDMGVFSNVEQVDKRFLSSRLGDDSGWLYKRSGGPSDGYETNEGQANPYEADFCIFDNNPCAPPADLETWLPQHLAIDQLLRVGAVNGLLANTDGPIAKANNFYSYDYAAGPRYYFPWDLDTVWKRSLEMFPGAGSEYQQILFVYWADDYDGLLASLLAGPLALEAVNQEIDRMVAVGAGAIDADPWLGGGSGATAGIAAELKSWYAGRHAEVMAQVGSH
jgi:spore coat protein CotH